MIFAKRLRELRVPRGFRTARSLAQAIGIDENRYTRYERAEVEPDLGLLMKICEVLGLTPNDLLMEMPSVGPTPALRATGTAMGEPRRSLATPVSPYSHMTPPGFGEAGPAPLVMDEPSTVETVTAPGTATATLKRRAIAWQLARLACAHGVAASAGAVAGAAELSSVQLTSRVFAAIERDPFAFVTAIAGSDRLMLLAEPEQKRIAALIDELVVAVDAAAHTPGPAGGHSASANPV